MIREEIKQEVSPNGETVELPVLTKIIDRVEHLKTAGSLGNTYAVTLDKEGKIIHDGSDHVQGQRLTDVVNHSNPKNRDYIMNTIMSGNDSTQNLNLSWTFDGDEKWVEFRVIPSAISSFKGSSGPYRVVLINEISESDAVRNFGAIRRFRTVYMIIVFGIFVGLIIVAYRASNLAVFTNEKTKIDEIKEIFSTLTHTQEELSRFHELLTEKEIELMNVEEEKRDTHTLLSRIVNTIPNIIMVRDQKDRITLINQYGANFLKISRQAAIGKTLNQILSLNSTEGISGSFGNSCELAKRKMMETLTPIIFIDDGVLYSEYTSLRIIMSPLLDENEMVIGTVSVGYSNLEFLTEISNVVRGLKSILGNSCTGKTCTPEIQKTLDALSAYLMKNYAMDGRLPEILQRNMNEGDLHE
jgi:PAS domain-containing protein